MVRLALIGDFHIPGRAQEIPAQFIEILKSEKFDKILCTGDLTEKSVYEELCELGEVKCVTGNMDYETDFPKEQVFTFGKYKVGLIHGSGIHPRGEHEQLLEIAERLEVDILIHGHTHKQEVVQIKDKLLVNPGSCTGVWGGGPADNTPGFVFLELNDKILVETLQLKDENVVKKSREFNP